MASVGSKKGNETLSFFALLCDSLVKIYLFLLYHKSVAVSLHHLDQRTGMTQIPQFTLQLRQVDGNWKISY